MRPLKAGSAEYCERPSQFCVVLPSWNGASAIEALLPATAPSTYSVPCVPESVTATCTQRPVGSALLLASGRPQPKLEAILASHALIHAADGEHFRVALREASQSCGLAVTEIREAELLERAQRVLEQPAARLQATVTSLGRALGPPWTQDQKMAALAAWVVLARADTPGRA